MDRIISAIKSSGTINKDAVVVIGVSGGPDSLCLLHALNSIKAELDLTIIPVHINHKFRVAADKEQEHIEEICKDLGLECSSFVIDCRKLAAENKLSDEEAGRLARYDAFNQIASQIEAQGVEHSRIVIAVAHNADDQSETVLQRIMRGTGIRGLAGMSSVRLDQSGYFIVRPILSVTRAEIEEYISANSLEPNMDESNGSTDYTRNRIRLELIPYMEEHFNPNVKSSLRNLSDIAAIDDNYMMQVAYAMYENSTEVITEDDAIVLDTEKASEMHIAILRRVISIILSQFGMDSDIGYAQISDVVSLIYTDKPSARIDLPGGLVAAREYRRLVFGSGVKADKDPLEGLRLITEVISRDRFEAPEKGCYAAFDYDKFSAEHPDMIGRIVLRTRQRGDVIGIGSGHKKIQNYFVDAKIPAAKRDQIPMIAAGSEILWVLPNGMLPTQSERNKGKFSHKYQIDSKTKQVLFLEIV